MVRNALLFMHRVKYFPTDLPISVYESVDICSPVRNADHDTNLKWFSQFNNRHFRSSVFLKGPLLTNTCTDKIKAILENFDGVVLKVIKSNLKRRLLDSQSLGDGDEWPIFPLHAIDGQRKSDR